MNDRIRDILALGRPGLETERARTTIELAVRCADELEDKVFDSCHLLAGLYREGYGVAYHVLNCFEVTGTQIDDSLESRERLTAPAFQIDGDMQVVFAFAFAAADKMTHRYIGTEHLLIGATADGTKSAKLITAWGLSPRDVENEVFCLLGHRFP